MNLTKINILLVDDEPSCVDNLAKDLRACDLKVNVAYSGRDAIQIVKDHPPDLMVIDLQMPEMDGLTLLKNVKSIHSDVQVIMLTGHVDDGDEATCYSMGAYSFLQKPVDTEVLLNNIGMAFSDKVENTFVAMSLAEGGAFEAADEILAEAEIAEEVLMDSEMHK